MADGDVYMLSTSDNPYNPFTEWAEWFAFDESHGYHSCSLLARLTFSSHDLSEPDQFDAIQTAIDEIVRDNYSGKHIKVNR